MRLQRSRTAALLLSLLAFPALASPASSYLDEVTRLLGTYDGPSTVDRDGLTRTAREELDRRCAPQADICTVDVARAVAQDLVKGFADRHTNLRDPQQARRTRAEMRGGSVARIGVRLVPEGDAAVVGYVRPGSPAERAGLEVGTFVGAINGGKPTSAALVAAEDGGTVTLDLGKREVTVTPVTLPARDLPTLRRVGDVNVVNIPTFLGEGVAAGFFEILRTLDPTQPLVVDVRANGGGSLSECLLASSAFTDARHELVSGQWRTSYTARQGVLYVGGRRVQSLGAVRAAPAARVAVLVSNRTASCGEVFAANLQRAGAAVVGTPTAGVGNSAVALYDLSDGGILSVTTSRALDASGRLVEAAVKPDRAVTNDPADLAAGRDPALQTALGLLAPTTATR